MPIIDLELPKYGRKLGKNAKLIPGDPVTIILPAERGESVVACTVIHQSPSGHILRVREDRVEYDSANPNGYPYRFYRDFNGTVHTLTRLSAWTDRRRRGPRAGGCLSPPRA